MTLYERDSRTLHNKYTPCTIVKEFQSAAYTHWGFSIMIRRGGHLTLLMTMHCDCHQIFKGQFDTASNAVQRETHYIRECKTPYSSG